MTVNHVTMFMCPQDFIHPNESAGRWPATSKFNAFQGSPFCTCLASATALFIGLPAFASTEIASRTAPSATRAEPSRPRLTT